MVKLLLTIHPSGCPIEGECNTLPIVFLFGVIVVFSIYGFYKAFIEK
jgi:hypothetical protein